MNAVQTKQPLILNVDDDPAGLYAKSRSLRFAGMSVMDAATGHEALELAEQTRPAMVLLDVNLPDISGLEVCRRIKQAWPETVVVQISATAIAMHDRIAGLDNGADCYLTTPIEPTELIAVARAMLRLRQAEAEAHRSNARYRTIVEGAVDYAIFTCDLNGCITSWNSGAQAVLGHMPEQVIGRHYACIFTAEDIADGVPELELQTARTGICDQAERWLLRADGTRFWSSGRLVPLREEGDTITGYLKILYDRTAAKDARDALVALNTQLEDRVKARTAALEDANRKLKEEINERARAEDQMRQLQKIEALGQLTGGIAHDFNNLLTAIIGGLELTRRRVDDDRAVKLIDGALSAANRGARLVNQLLAFARKQTLNQERVIISALVSEMRDLLEHSIGAATNITFDLPDNTWPVMADANQLQVSLLNLVINARDAMDNSGAMWIRVANEHVGPDEASAIVPGDYVALSVRDSGTGMTLDVQQRIFEPFFTTKAVGKGTGLGLAQVYGFVRQSGGDVQVESAPGEGTTMRILLPRAAEP